MDILFQVMVGLLTVLASMYGMYISSESKRKERAQRIDWHLDHTIIMDKSVPTTPIIRYSWQSPIAIENTIPQSCDIKESVLRFTLQEMVDDVDCSKLIAESEAKAEAKWKEEMNAPIR